MLSPAPQYRCANQARARLLAADATFAGIDFVEVPEDEGLARRPGVSTDIDLRGRILILHLPVVVTNGLPDMLVQGGVTITDLPIAWGASADVLIANPLADHRRSRRGRPGRGRSSFPGCKHCPIRIRSWSSAPSTSSTTASTSSRCSTTSWRSPAPSASRFCSVHLFVPVPTTLESSRPLNLEITGGVRIPNVNVLWAVSATTLLRPSANGHHPSARRRHDDSGPGPACAADRPGRARPHPRRSHRRQRRLLAL